MAETLENPSVVSHGNEEQAWVKREPSAQLLSIKLEFSSAQLVAKLPFPNTTSLKQKAFGGSSVKSMIDVCSCYSPLHFVVHFADDSHSFISFL